MSGATILIVEDDLDIAEALHEMLADEGYRVARAGNGREALELLHARLEPEVILLDLMMPEMDGAQFRRAQLREPELAQIPVIVLSADRALDQRARELGVQDYAAKPFEPERLLSLVAGCTSTRDA